MAKHGLAAMFGGKPKDDAGEDDDAAQDVLDAISEGDAKALSMALKRHYELCASGGSDEDEDDEED